MERREPMPAGGGGVLSATLASRTTAQDTTLPHLITDDVIVTRLFSAPIERVFAAFTTEADVLRWWGPDNYSCPVARMDVRPGGTSVVCMRSPDGQDMWMRWD